MFEYLTSWIQLTTDCRAVTAIEYGLIAALVAGVVVTTVATLGTTLEGLYTSVSNAYTAG
jgi:pilus assembly protein Flp/PilA